MSPIELVTWAPPKGESGELLAWLLLDARDMDLAFFRAESVCELLAWLTTALDALWVGVLIVTDT